MRLDFYDLASEGVHESTYALSVETEPSNMYYVLVRFA